MSIVRLLPAPAESRPLEGTWLALDLHWQASGQPLVYANYIASLDGRIALRDPASGEFGVPASLGNRRDWRLFQELAAQADVLITSGRYFRQLAKGTAQAMLPLGNEPEYADLHAWRRQQGFATQPDVVVLSRSLDIPAAAIRQLAGRRLIALTAAGHDSRQRSLLQAQGVEVVELGSEQVEGEALYGWLTSRGYRTAYMIAGPEVHATLLAAGRVGHLFLTTRHVLLGGSEFHTLLQGPLPQPAELELRELYLDSSPGREQSFAHYLLRS